MQRSFWSLSKDALPALISRMSAVACFLWCGNSALEESKVMAALLKSQSATEHQLGWLLICVSHLLPRFQSSAGRRYLIWRECVTRPVPLSCLVPSHNEAPAYRYNLTSSRKASHSQKQPPLLLTGAGNASIKNPLKMPPLKTLWVLEGGMGCRWESTWGPWSWRQCGGQGRRRKLTA